MSDRIEKESEESEVVKRLEWGGATIVKGDWKRHISQELQEGLYWFYLLKICSMSEAVLFWCLIRCGIDRPNWPVALTFTFNIYSDMFTVQFRHDSQKICIPRDTVIHSPVQLIPVLPVQAVKQKALVAMQKLLTFFQQKLSMYLQYFKIEIVTPC